MAGPTLPLAWTPGPSAAGRRLPWGCLCLVTFAAAFVASLGTPHFIRAAARPLSRVQTAPVARRQFLGIGLGAASLAGLAPSASAITVEACVSRCVPECNKAVPGNEGYCASTCADYCEKEAANLKPDS